jgi:hypothetical protein
MIASYHEFSVTPIVIRMKTKDGHEISILEPDIFHVQIVPYKREFVAVVCSTTSEFKFRTELDTIMSATNISTAYVVEIDDNNEGPASASVLHMFVGPKTLAGTTCKICESTFPCHNHRSSLFSEL